MERSAKNKKEITNDENDCPKEYKSTDFDIVARIWEDDDNNTRADEKRRQNLRQIRKRYKNKLP